MTRVTAEHPPQPDAPSEHQPLEMSDLIQCRVTLLRAERWSQRILKRSLPAHAMFNHCVQCHSWHFQIILFLKTFPWLSSIFLSSFLYGTPDVTNFVPLPKHHRYPLKRGNEFWCLLSQQPEEPDHLICFYSFSCTVHVMVTHTALFTLNLDFQTGKATHENDIGEN